MKSYTHYSNFFLFFFFNDTATTEIYTLSLHDALPIWPGPSSVSHLHIPDGVLPLWLWASCLAVARSEEHTSELQSHVNLVCRLLLEKKNKHLNLLSPHRQEKKKKLQ